MPPVIRRLFLASTILLGLLLALVASLPYLVSFDAVRTRLLAAAESALHRRVEAGTIRLQIFTGIGAGAENVVVRNGPGWETPALLTADRVSAKLAFWPLLSGRIEIRKLVLDGVTLTVERDRNGAVNVGDLAPTGPATGKPGDDLPPASPGAVRVSTVVLERGSVRFVDRGIVPGRTVTSTLDAVEGRVAGISAYSPTYVELAGRLLADGERNVSVEGHFGPPRPDRSLGESPLSLRFSASGLSLARLAPYLGAPRGSDPGVLTVSATANGAALGRLALSGHAAFQPGKDKSAGPRIPAIDGRFAGTLDWPRGSLLLERSPVTVASLPLTVSGRVGSLRAAPRIDLRLEMLEEAPIERVTDAAGLTGRLPAGVRFAGRVRLAAELSGPARHPAVRASLSAAPLSVSRDGQPVLTAASATATLEPARGGLQSGRVSVPAGKVREVSFVNLNADWAWDGSTLVVTPEAEVYGGRIAARLESESRGGEPEMRARVRLAGVHGQPLVESATTARHVFSGTMDGALSLVTRGLSWDAIRHSAKGDGRVSVSGPNLYTVHLKPEIGGMLAKLGKYASFVTPPSLESTTFERLETSLRLGDGRLETPDLVLAGRDAAVHAAGALGLDKTLDYRGRVVLEPTLVQGLGTVGQYIANAEGRVVFPFQVTGTIDAPKISIDTAAILDLGRRIAARLAGDKLGGWWKVLGEAVGSGALPMPGFGGDGGGGGFPIPGFGGNGGSGGGGFPMPGGGGFPFPGGGGFPMPPMPGNLLQQFMRRGDSNAQPQAHPNSAPSPQPAPSVSEF